MTKISITRATAQLEEMAIYKGVEIVDQINIVDERLADDELLAKVQLWKYNPLYFSRNRSVDPVSLACSFKGNEDERIEMSIEEPFASIFWEYIKEGGYKCGRNQQVS